MMDRFDRCRELDQDPRMLDAVHAAARAGGAGARALRVASPTVTTLALPRRTPPPQGAVLTVQADQPFIAQSAETPSSPLNESRLL